MSGGDESGKNEETQRRSKGMNEGRTFEIDYVLFPPQRAGGDWLY